MPPIDIAGSGGLAGGRPLASNTGIAPSQADLAARDQRLRAVAPAAPAYGRQAVTQGREVETTRPRTERADRSMMLHSQSLAAAVQEELRLQQRLSDLRESIEATENRLRQMQESLQSSIPVAKAGSGSTSGSAPAA